jgi:type VI secretion system protein ImpK
VRGVDRQQEDALSILARDFFVLGGQIQSGQVELPDCVTFRRRVMQLFDEMNSKAAKANVVPTDLEDARYAIAAYLDELIQYSSWPGRLEWSQQPLQAVLFSEARAGVGFFDRLMGVRQRDSPALLIFYQCLVLGFMGEYRLSGDLEQHDRLVTDLARELSQGASKTLSPHGQRPDGDDIGRKRALLLPIAVICLSVSAVVFLGLYVWIEWVGSDAVDTLTEMVRR